MENALETTPATRPTPDVASPPRPQPPVMERLGKYEILCKLGQGGMGEVYKGHDPVIGRDVAIKVIHERALEDPSVKPRFYREARSAGRLSHPNITIIYDVNEEDGRPYLVMEHLDGHDLRSILKSGAALTKKQKQQIAVQICKGLLYAHEKNIIHRDIKPENIRVLPDGTVKIMDFGIARIQSDTTTLTQTNASLGTPRYMAPEQVKGEELDHRADIFSFGVLFHELFSGVTPFTGENLTTLIYKILHTEPEPLNITPEALREDLQHIVSTCLEKEPENRYASFAEVLRDVEAISIPEEETAGATKKISKPTRRRRTPRRASTGARQQRPARKGLWIALGILLVVGLAAGSLAVFQPAFIFPEVSATPETVTPPASPAETQAAAALTITPGHVTMGVGDKEFLSVEIWNAQGERLAMEALKPATLQWNTGDSTIAAIAGVSMVDEQGLGGIVTARAQGKTTITVALDGVVQFIPVEVGISSEMRAEAEQQYRQTNALLIDPTLTDSAVGAAFETLRDAYGAALDEETQADIEQKIEHLAVLIAAFQQAEAQHQQDALTIFEKRAVWQAYLDQALTLRQSPAMLHATQRISEIDETIASTATLEADSFVTCERTVAGGSTGALRLCRDSALKNQFTPGTPVYLNAKTNAARSARIRWTWTGPDGTELQQKNTRVMGVQGYRVWDVLKASETQQEGDYQIRIYNEKDLLIGRRSFTITK